MCAFSRLLHSSITVQFDSMTNRSDCSTPRLVQSQKFGGGKLRLHVQALTFVNFSFVQFLDLIESYLDEIKDVEVERSFDSPRSVCSESFAC